jgi:hypothetical protein
MIVKIKTFTYLKSLHTYPYSVAHLAVCGLIQKKRVLEDCVSLAKHTVPLDLGQHIDGFLSLRTCVWVISGSRVSSVMDLST